MIGTIMYDEAEEKRCNAIEYAQKFKSYRLGLEAGKEDARHLSSLDHKAKNPYPIPSEVLELLRKRARWQAGYELGWSIIGQKRLAKQQAQQEERTTKKKKHRE